MMVKRVVKDPEERRKELIDTAERLFITAGYDQTAISDIVREINISRGHIITTLIPKRMFLSQYSKGTLLLWRLPSDR